MIHELKHYYNGSKLLCTETKITFGLLQQVLNGHRLTRRERKQLTRTINDLFRVVPFSVFIIVPFMEFTLPIFLKLFPNMLPSTFKQINNNEENLKKFFQIKLEATQFLQDTIFKSQDISFNDMITIQFEEFLQKIHTSDNYPTINEIVEFSSRFSHKLTIDNLDRSQLTALCKLFNLSFNGPKHYLRYKLRLKLYRLKNDDKLILNEGITNLNIEELQAACHERGINSFDINNKSLQSQLQQWLDLHSDKSISPITILLILHKIKTKDTTVSQPIYVNASWLLLFDQQIILQTSSASIDDYTLTSEQMAVVKNRNVISSENIANTDDDHMRNLVIGHEQFDDLEDMEDMYESESSADDIIELNVGGQKMTTYRSTLTAVPNSSLALLFTKDPKDKTKLKIKHNKIKFFDHNPVQFAYLLDQLRSIKRMPKIPKHELNIVAPNADIKFNFSTMLF
ncbi:unnamed protein product [Adineta steineri]|uniref:Letm1 RBD domain-containing protein n=1 Tax=Adineta steineri TaxID=433720 RepID=A0A814LRW7_9BILA|nr:unnamed protein product [Adineta steineri]CAF1290956.1 unnamed protein product [Adineta steineri]CAF3574272.1 unnamed protein product [Adineta steineri]CAF3685242.1 unnamed protein product [Adineta steineri]CAF3777550.1 unnamed protein product [Adineta steineri]